MHFFSKKLHFLPYLTHNAIQYINQGDHSAALIDYNS